MDSSKNSSLTKNHQTDSQLKTLLKNDQNSGWNAIYDKYAAVMYGNILNIINDKVLAEKIFIVAFKSLKESELNLSTSCSITLYLCAFGKKIAIEYLKAGEVINH